MIFQSRIPKPHYQSWGNFKYYYKLDFSKLTQPGRYYLWIKRHHCKSLFFTISSNPYQGHQDSLLQYMRQQRCGYNPFIDEVCHQLDGRTMYGPMPDSTYIDVSGGWHDAGDDLKYMITSSFATAAILLAFQLAPAKFVDTVDELGHPLPNGIPDVLDEAKWGLDWLHKMHPKPDQLFHQVADDRDHTGWKLPHQDNANYGWGSGSYRVVYYANGKPQGLRQYQSESTGIANIAGRYAAAMALAHRVWREVLHDTTFAQLCLKAGVEVYQLGKQHEGYQQGNSFGAPYRYTENTWADDMEWGAAELFKSTKDQRYLQDAKHYGKLINSTAWMGRDSTHHYQFYPFVNLGHFSLYDLVDQALQDTLAGYYRDGLEKCLRKAQANPFAVGVPFIWCSNNLVVALITQCLLYENMTGDTRYHELMLAQRDWLFGRNPWGVSMFVGIPPTGITPKFPHSSIAKITGRQITGGLVDGPVYGSIFQNLKYLSLSKPDEFALCQSPHVVYHDDVMDYATNEPTMDGTAAAILMMALLNR